MAGDYSFYQRTFGRVSSEYDLAAATGGPVTDLLTSKSANHQIFVQRIVVCPFTYSNKTLTFQDDAGTPVILAFQTIPASGPSTSGLQHFEHDFGPLGCSITKGTNLDLVLSGAGVAGKITIEGYQKLIGPVAAASTN